MPRPSKLSRSRTIQDAYAITSTSVLDFLVPAIYVNPSLTTPRTRKLSSFTQRHVKTPDTKFETSFYSALSQASTCNPAICQRTTRQHSARSSQYRQSACFRTTTIDGEQRLPEHGSRRRTGVAHSSTAANGDRAGREEKFHTLNAIENTQDICATAVLDTTRLSKSRDGDSYVTGQSQELPADFFNDHFERQFAEGSHLPSTFYNDVTILKNLIPPWKPDAVARVNDGEIANTLGEKSSSTKQTLENITSYAMPVEVRYTEPHESGLTRLDPRTRGCNVSSPIADQMKLLKSVRELEEKLAKAKQDLTVSMRNITKPSESTTSTSITNPSSDRNPIPLSKEDYMNLVDLYYYSHNSRFSPESTDASPTPTFLDDFSFKISEDFSANERTSVNENEEYTSPLKHVEEMLMSGKIREIAVMQVFVDLLLDDKSSNRALFEAYKNFSDPGVASLPKGILRVFLQRMSTPWTHSEKSMLRYLSLIDDMQKAGLPITLSEWSSAIYLAGRSFSQVTESDVANSFGIWRRMEKEAGVQSSHITFNILFDIAVRAGKFALGQTILMEMSQRNLRLNRLGRVSLIYYHGLRGDGDGVRKTYRDFVEAGEVVDTLVLNCVIAALLNAQEPTAAEQVYGRMRSLQTRLRKGVAPGGSEDLYMRYPPPAKAHIDQDMASNHLGRILVNARHLRDVLPDHHTALQANMPLKPDIKTFSTMIAYHATKSGDIDRLSVLLSEMTDVFQIPLDTLIFQLLFKGFALHGPVGGPDSPWSLKRLDLCWSACRQAIKNSEDPTAPSDSMARPQDMTDQRTILPVRNSRQDSAHASPTLPSMAAINAIPYDSPLPAFDPPLNHPPPRRLSAWNEFVLDLAAFPRQRLKRIERFHAQMFDDENVKQPHESRLPFHTHVSPFFQSTVYTSPEPALDHEEGEYVLPNPAETTLFQSTSTHRDNKYDIDGSYKDSGNTTASEIFGQDPSLRKSTKPKPVVATRSLICWLLRAYARNSKSRAKLEEIWGSVRKIWRPRDEAERESVVRVLRRCLRDCDREGRS